MAYRNIAQDGAYRIYPKKKKEEPISTIDEYQNAFIKSLEAYETKQKKPVRWNFLKDNEGMFQLGRAINPMIKTNESLYRIITRAMGDEKPYWTELKAKEFRLKSKERDYIEGFDEIAKGVETGKHGLGLSLGELLFMGTDLATFGHTNFLSDFQKMMDRQKPEEPETWRGDLAQLMVQYGLPASFISKIKIRAKGLQKVKDAIAKMFGHKASKIASRVAHGATVLGATDALVSPDKRRMGTLFVKPEDTSKLSGGKKALAVLRNKVRYGVEGTIVGGVFPLAGKAFQQAYKYAGRPVGEPFVRMGFNVAGAGFQGASWLLAKNPALHSKISKQLVGSTKYGIKKMISPMARQLAKMGAEKAPPFERWRLFQVTSPKSSERGLKRLDNVLSWMRSYGKMPKDIEGVSEEVSLFIKSRARKLDKLLEGIEKRAYSLAKKYEKRHLTNDTSRPYEKMLKDDIVDYLQGTVKLGKVHKELRPFAYEIKKRH